MSNLALFITPDLTWEKHIPVFKCLSYAFGFVVILFEALSWLLFHKLSGFGSAYA